MPTRGGRSPPLRRQRPGGLDRLTGIASQTSALSGREEDVHAVGQDRHRAGTRRRLPFFFGSAIDASGGRYDLPPPAGSCYRATGRAGALLVVFRSGIVPVRDLRARRLCTTVVPRPVRAADLLAAWPRALGMTAEIHTCADYRLPRAWAQGLNQAGFPALWGQARHDPTLRQRTVIPPRGPIGVDGGDVVGPGPAVGRMLAGLGLLIGSNGDVLNPLPGGRQGRFAPFLPVRGVCPSCPDGQAATDARRIEV